MSYIGVVFVSHSSVSVFQSLDTIFAPAFGVVVFNHTLPVGLGVVSPDLNSGTLVCAEICNAGGLYVPAVSPSAVSLSASPPITTGPPNELSSAPELVPSL